MSVADTHLSPEEQNRLRSELEKRDKELTAVLKISHALSSMTSVDDLVRETLEVLLETIGAHGGALYLYDEKKDRLVFSYVINTENPAAAADLIGKALEPGQGIAGQVFQSGQAELVSDAVHDPRHHRALGERTGYVTRNMVTLPLMNFQGKRVGVMQALNKIEGSFDEEDLDLLSIMGTQAMTAIENARLFEEARAASIMHYLGDISHDIKNLMTPAQTGAQTLEAVLLGTFEGLDRFCRECEDSAYPSRVKEVCRSLRELYPEMIGMVTDSVDAAQERVREIADALKGVIAEPVFEPASVADLIRTVLRTLKGVAEKNGVTLLTEGLEDAPALLLDKKRLYSAIYNLVNNAIPETPSGGSITVRVSSRPEGTFPEGAYVQIEVADTGRGMPEEVKARLFTENAISTKPGGTGLGTRIVKNAIDAHGGTVTVDSEAGEGTTFTVRLPYKSS
ncbi:MAG: GAF domain-containing sensor histidine kinase [Armatimonadetes bacterium]|nr:GAF domain-containing sensor histidine kinase [Armatimonadota bacterium]